MGKGAELALAAGLSSVEGQRILDDFKEQFLLTMVRRLVGVDKELVVPVADIDSNHGFVMTMESRPDTRDFVFKVTRKQ